MNKNDIKKITPFVKPYLGQLILSFLCAGVSSAVALIIPIFCGKAIDFMLGAGKVDFYGVLKFAYYIAVSAIIEIGRAHV